MNKIDSIYIKFYILVYTLSTLSVFEIFLSQIFTFLAYCSLFSSVLAFASGCDVTNDEYTRLSAGYINICLNVRINRGMN